MAEQGLLQVPFRARWAGFGPCGQPGAGVCSARDKERKPWAEASLAGATLPWPQSSWGGGSEVFMVTWRAGGQPANPGLACTQCHWASAAATVAAN